MGTRNKWQTSDGAVTLYCGEAAEVLEREGIEADAVVADPPYGLRFMGRRWDYDVPAVRTWEAILAALPPGGHLLSFFGTRTYHRGVVAIEDAGFEIRDQIAWIYGSGFPKSLDVSKAIDKAAGAEREAMGRGRGRTGPAAQPNGGSLHSDDNYQWPGEFDITAPATEAARQWNGWGTALKPAQEPIVLARKPLVGTVAANVLEHGCGGLNIDGCRVGDESTVTVRNGNSGAHGRYGKDARVFERENPPGRWPANIIHDGSDEALAVFPQTAISRQGTTGGAGGQHGKLSPIGGRQRGPGHGDSGSAARFFYCAKASKADRDEGNAHPTVKPTALMRWLIRLVAPAGAIVLDPFMGSGSTGKAAVAEGVRFVGIDRDRESFRTSIERIKKARRAFARPRELAA